MRQQKEREKHLKTRHRREKLQKEKEKERKANKKLKLKVSYAVENRVLQKKKVSKLLSLIQILNLRTMVELRCHGLIGV